MGQQPYSAYSSPYSSGYGAGGYGAGGYGNTYGGGYGNTYGSPYGSMMGTGYSGYGSGMGYNRFGTGYSSGLYGNRFGNYNNTGMGPMGGPPFEGGEVSFSRQMEMSTQSAFQTLDQIVQTFGGFAHMLESTFFATHSSFMAMVNSPSRLILDWCC